MKVICYLDCGCAILENGKREWCPSCLSPNMSNPNCLAIELTSEEIEIILDDQIVSLKSEHIPQDKECGEMKDCPPEHFDEGILEEILYRQNLIKKLEEKMV